MVIFQAWGQLEQRDASVGCPYCASKIPAQFTVQSVGPSKKESLHIARNHCPVCDRWSIYRVHGQLIEETREPDQLGPDAELRLLWPRSTERAPVPAEVPETLAGLYREASLVIGDSPRASGALSRCCLQFLLRDRGGTTKRDLADQIAEVLPNLPSNLAGALDAIRVVGNFAAHPIKSTSTGTIVDVEPGEAEWNLDTLELLFDYYFVQPRILQERREALNKKLADAGKPPLRG